MWLLIIIIIAEARNGLTNARQHVRLVAHELLKLGKSIRVLGIRAVLVLRSEFVIEIVKGDGLHLPSLEALESEFLQRFVGRWSLGSRPGPLLTVKKEVIAPAGTPALRFFSFVLSISRTALWPRYDDVVGGEGLSVLLKMGRADGVWTSLSNPKDYDLDQKLTIYFPCS